MARIAVCKNTSSGAGLSGRQMGMTDNCSNAKAGASVKPIIIAQLIDLHPLPLARRIRHRLCHNQRLWFSFHRLRDVVEDVGRQIEMILKG